MSDTAEAAERWKIAQALDRADDRWQHGIGSGGYDMSDPRSYWLMLADGLIASGLIPPGQDRAAPPRDEDVMSSWRRNHDDPTRPLYWPFEPCAQLHEPGRVCIRPVGHDE